ncbi:glycosyltransferase family 4 protein [Microbulbifer sp. A4B17]|uniref:MraY family glycosyltransferase n=1 Tax=Microbulbifer sp. A4B17 TaxID=359370 RepID=UPI001EE0B790|nr:glycosyltransferase family 4 protein [Microbulbifer sp. A4B17]
MAWEWVIPLLLAVAASYGSTSMFIVRMRNFALDVPNNRSMHSVPVPRTGGWAFLLGCLVAVVAGPLDLSPLVLAAFVLLLGVSALDDLRDVPIHFRFSAHLLAVALLLFALPERLEWWLYPIFILAGAWVVNLYNFMDGMDGLAGSMTLVGFSSLGVICALNGDMELAWLCALVAVCASVFLVFNWPSAKIFLGDAGSTGIGLAVVAVSLFGWQRGAFELWMPVVIFAPFWLDATYTLLKRMVSGQRWWEPHREHFYQRYAIRAGVKKALVLQLGAMIFFSLLALAAAVFAKV